MMITMSEPIHCQIMIISGQSGAGKSVAVRALEDSGWYCVDNLPISTMKGVVDTLRAGGLSLIGLGLDARHHGSLEAIFDVIQSLRAEGVWVRLLFLEAASSELLRRFAEARRPHPMASEGHSLEESIKLERIKLNPLAEQSRRIDTTSLRPNALRAVVKAFASADPQRLSLFIFSFGFKYGIPQEADFVFDVRFLPNPFYDPVLRPLNGKDKAIVDFLEAQPMTQKILDDLFSLISNWLPSFINDHRHVLSIAIGCTGGQHRSVYLAEELAKKLSPLHPTWVVHRSLES
jgi:RNase adapter protein RapZ